MGTNMAAVCCLSARTASPVPPPPRGPGTQEELLPNRFHSLETADGGESGGGGGWGGGGSPDH